MYRIKRNVWFNVACRLMDFELSVRIHLVDTELHSCGDFIIFFLSHFPFLGLKTFTVKKIFKINEIIIFKVAPNVC